MIEAGLGHLPFTEMSVTTPTGRIYVGVDFAKKLCGVSIIRSGESMENALRACCKGIKIGKILVHRWRGPLPAFPRSCELGMASEPDISVPFHLRVLPEPIAVLLQGQVTSAAAAAQSGAEQVQSKVRQNDC